jgi:hypothetical protein
MGMESGQPLPEDAKQVIARDDGWFIVGPDGGEIAGPFVTLDDVEDYLDAHDARTPKPSDPPAESPPDPITARGAASPPA